MNGNVRADWFVYYTSGSPEQQKTGYPIEMIRIGADCLGNAITAAKEIAKMCRLQIVGVVPGVGVRDEG